MVCGMQVYTRDQQITTSKGIVMARLRSSVRELEVALMKFCFDKLGMDHIDSFGIAYAVHIQFVNYDHWSMAYHCQEYLPRRPAVLQGSADPLLTCLALHQG